MLKLSISHIMYFDSHLFNKRPLHLEFIFLLRISYIFVLFDIHMVILMCNILWK